MFKRKERSSQNTAFREFLAVSQPTHFPSLAAKKNVKLEASTVAWRIQSTCGNPFFFGFNLLKLIFNFFRCIGQCIKKRIRIAFYFPRETIMERMWTVFKRMKKTTDGRKKQCASRICRLNRCQSIWMLLFEWNMNPHTASYILTSFLKGMKNRIIKCIFKLVKV